MVDLSKLSPAALKAAMTGGTKGWGQSASIRGFRYMEAAPRSWRRRCRCCGGRVTHVGRVNGISLFSGCEFRVRRWVKDPMSAIRSRALQASTGEGEGDG